MRNRMLFLMYVLTAYFMPSVEDIFFDLQQAFVLPTQAFFVFAEPALAEVSETPPPIAALDLHAFLDLAVQAFFVLAEPALADVSETPPPMAAFDLQHFLVAMPVQAFLFVFPLTVFTVTFSPTVAEPSACAYAELANAKPPRTRPQIIMNLVKFFISKFSNK